MWKYINWLVSHLIWDIIGSLKVTVDSYKLIIVVKEFWITAENMKRV